MICKKCGNEIDGKLPFCPYCGCSTAEAQSANEPVNEQVDEQVNEQPTPAKPQAPAQAPGVYYANGQPVQPQPGQPVYISTDKFGGFPMKWYKFMTYFGVWASAVIHFITGVSRVTGNLIRSVNEVSEVNPFKQIGDVIYGVILLGVAALAIVTGFALLNLKKNAPVLLHSLFIASSAVSVIYDLILTIVNSENVNYLFVSGSGLIAGITSLIISCGVSALIIVLNVIYYNKRKQFFIN